MTENLFLQDSTAWDKLVSSSTSPWNDCSKSDRIKNYKELVLREPVLETSPTLALKNKQ